MLTSAKRNNKLWRQVLNKAQVKTKLRMKQQITRDTKVPRVTVVISVTFGLLRTCIKQILPQSKRLADMKTSSKEVLIKSGLL